MRDGKWMAIKLVRSFPRKQSVSEFKIIVLHLCCVLCVLAAGRRLFMSAECATGIFLYFYQSGNRWSKTTSTWKCCTTLVLSEVGIWNTNLHFEVIFLIVQLRHWQLFIGWMRNDYFKLSATNLRLNGWKKRERLIFFMKKPSLHSKFHAVYEIKASPNTCSAYTLYPLRAVR